jgi:hypothetical protein
MSSKNETVVSKDVAMEELTTFLKKQLPKEFRRGKMTSEKIEEDYIDVLEAIEDGLLVFDSNGKPVYELRSPLKNSEGEISIKQVTFRSRIKGADKTILMNGIDPKKQLGDYMIKVISYMTQIDSNELVKKLEKEDFDVLNQICSVF